MTRTFLLLKDCRSTRWLLNIKNNNSFLIFRPHLHFYALFSAKIIVMKELDSEAISTTQNATLTKILKSSKSGKSTKSIKSELCRNAALKRDTLITHLQNIIKLHASKLELCFIRFYKFVILTIGVISELSRPERCRHSNTAGSDSDCAEGRRRVPHASKSEREMWRQKTREILSAVIPLLINRADSRHFL